jgi:hypothetical protein
LDGMAKSTMEFLLHAGRARWAQTGVAPVQLGGKTPGISVANMGRGCAPLKKLRVVKSRGLAAITTLNWFGLRLSVLNIIMATWLPLARLPIGTGMTIQQSGRNVS